MNGDERRRTLFSVFPEEFRQLCGEFQTAFSFVKHILVATAIGGEGSTTIAISLAQAFAENPERRVLLIDANRKDPTLHQLFGLTLSPGLRDWDACSPLSYRETSLASNLFVLTAGGNNHAEPRGMQLDKFKAVIQQVRQDFDFGIWDAPPLTRYPEGLSLAAAVDGVLLVIESDRTNRETLGLLRTQLARAEARLLGAILNRSGRFLPRVLRSRYDS